MGRSTVMVATLAGIALAISRAGVAGGETSQQAIGGGASVAQRQAPDGVKAHRDLAYIEAGHTRQKLDLYLPDRKEGATAVAPLPLLLWVHGGGWQSGDESLCLPLRQGFVERGYAVASIGYRLSGDAPFPAQIQDVKAAVRWLRAHAKEYNLDPDRFGAWGSSAGGHLVTLLGTSGGVEEFDKSDKPAGGVVSSSRVQAVCDFYGPTDLVRMVQTPGYEGHARADAPEGKLLGGAVLENRDKAARANPHTYLDKNDPPFLIIHGDSDPVVPLGLSKALFDDLKKVGVRVRFHTLRGASHGGPGFSAPEITQMVTAFFDNNLKGKSGTASPSAEPGTPLALATESEAQGPDGSGFPGGQQPQRQRPPWDVILARNDADRDGKLSRAEFPGPLPLFGRLDRDGDGFITRQEHEAAMPGGSPPGRVPAALPPVAPPPQVPPEAGKPAESVAPSDTGLQWDGDRWTYRKEGQTVSGILLKPQGKGPFPAILISHGRGGSAENFGRDKGREMVKWGYICIAPDYTHGAAAGLRGGGPMPSVPGTSSDFGASAENLRRARVCLDILRGMPEVDGSRLFAYGHSMGGFVTIGLAAAEPRALRAAAITGSGVAPREGYPAPAEASARKIRAPFLMMHGSADTTVRPEQSASLKAALDAGRVPNERHVFEGEGHGIDRTRRDEVFRRVREWFDGSGKNASRNDATKDTK